MAKQSAGYMGGFNGKLGPAVGYMWRGVWCVRSHQPYPRNPRTEAQVAHRAMFKKEVQLAASMRWAVSLGFKDLAYDWHMTPYNLFVHLNQGAFSLVDGRFTVDYGALRLCSGQRAAVAVGEREWTADNVLSVGFAKDGSGLRADAYDNVYLYVYCPDLELGYMASAVYRKAKRVSVSLPDSFAGREVHLYFMACSRQGEWSETVYAGAMTLVEGWGGAAAGEAEEAAAGVAPQAAAVAAAGAATAPAGSTAALKPADGADSGGGG